jgi:hypothetical protein
LILFIGLAVLNIERGELSRNVDRFGIGEGGFRC